MYIKNFHIEEFGPLENIDVENLPQTMAVFLGDNEAGKSSSMEFIRTMLTGIPNRRDLFSQSIKKFRGGPFFWKMKNMAECVWKEIFPPAPTAI